MKDLLGGCLLAAGILVAGATGLCMSMFFSGADKWRSLAGALNYLGLPFLVGIAMIIIGIVLISSGRRGRH